MASACALIILIMTINVDYAAIKSAFNASFAGGSNIDIILDSFINKPSQVLNNVLLRCGIRK